jgi:hypothetical protein
MITVAPFTVNPGCNCILSSIGYGEEHIKRYHLPITYWGIYIDDEYVSYTSSKELAEKTKVWMEKWLKEQTLK